MEFKSTNDLDVFFLEIGYFLHIGKSRANPTIWKNMFGCFLGLHFLHANRTFLHPKKIGGARC